jgi:chemotaxis signal transduction protein
MHKSKDETAGGPRAAELLARAGRALADHTVDPRQIEAAYRARAAALAQPTQAAAGDSAIIPAAVFRVGNGNYAARLSTIERVIPDPVCAPLPGASDRWAGVMAVDGEILPLLHLARVLGLPESGLPAGPHVLKLRSVSPPCGLLVGEVLEVRGFKASELRPADGNSPLAEAVAPGNVLLLDMASLIEREISQ